MDKKDYPLSVLRDIEKLNREFQKLAFENDDIIQIKQHDKSLIFFQDRSKEAFFFRVTNPNQTSDRRTFFNFYYVPENEHTITRQGSHNNEVAEVVKHCTRWLNLLRQYDAISLTPDEAITKQYEEEFFQDLDILDEDAYTAAFKPHQQDFIYKLLSFIETELKKQEDENAKSIVASTYGLKENIQNLPKKNSVRWLSKILAGLKKNFPNILREIWSEGKKVFIKRGIDGGLDEFISLFN